MNRGEYVDKLELDREQMLRELQEILMQNQKLRSEMASLARKNEHLRRTAQTLRTAWRGAMKANQSLAKLNRRLRGEPNERVESSSRSDAMTLLKHMPGT